MADTSRISRRAFTKAAALAGATAAVGIASAQTKPTTKATTTSKPVDRIRIGFIGVGNRGDQNLAAFLTHEDAEIVAICDLHQPYLDFASQRIGTNPQQYRDYRKLLDRKDIDAVVISSPDHWHALHTIHACQAGKDVFIEKPLSLTIAEGCAMSDAAKHYKRVTQVGLIRRSQDTCRQMVEFLRGGGIGKITTARAFHIQNEWPHGIGHVQDSQPPADFDWDAWVGPAPMRPYNANRTLYRFRWFYDYSGGQMTNTGAHYLDMIQWALGQDAPRSVCAMGGKIADFDDREVPDTMEAMFTYDGGTLVTFSQYNASNAEAAAKPCEVEFRGTKGTVYFRGDSFEVVADKTAAREYPILSPLDRKGPAGWRDGKPVIESKLVKGTQGNATPEHARNFLDCVRSRKQCVCDIETGHRSTSATIIANIAHRTRSLLDWDAKSERFTNNEDANKLLSYAYRKPYELPKIG
jgi:predicted dehydrogenase